MKNLYYLLLAILIIYLDDFDLKAQCTLDRTDWGSPVFFDEFDTYSDISELDTKWSLVYYGNPLLSPVHTLIENDEIEYYDANQFELYDGLLKIKATHLPYGETIEYFGKELFYKSGLLRAKYPLTECLDYKEDGIGFKYGLFEIRCKMPKPEQKGMWPAFWLQWAGKEIDIFELSVTTEHLSNYYTMNIHDNSAETGNACNFGLLYQGEDNLYDNFHTYSIVWSPPVGLIPAKVTYFFDDKEIKTIDYFIPQGCPLDLIVNLAVKEGATSIEGELIVDYVRVYEKTDYSEYKTEEDWFQAPLDWSWNNTFNSNHTNNNIVYSESSNRIYYVDDLNRIRFFKENSGEWVNIKVIPDDSPAENFVLGDIVVNGNDKIYYRGQNGYLQSYHKTTVWNHSDIGGLDLPPSYQINDQPNSLIIGDDNNIFYISNSGRIRRFYFDGTSWVNSKLGGSIVPYDELASTSIACYDSDNIYYRGNDGYLQCYRYNGTSWVHEYLGSSLDPSIRKVSNNPNSIVVVNGVVYYRGHDNLIHYYKYDGSLWNYSFINIRNSENKVKDNLKLGYNGKLFYLGQDNKIHYFEKLGVVWTQGSIYSNLWFDPYIYSYFDVSLSENKIFYSNDDDHVFNLYYETCENLNPPCITDEFGECVPIEACLGMYKEFSDILLTDNIINNNEIIIYPNPATSYIKVNNIERKAEQLNNYYYKIMTPSGGIISDGILAEQNIIDVSELETGIYFLFIDNNANRMIKSFLKIN